MKERDCTFDIMKGIAMVLVILSHTAPLVNWSLAYWRSALFLLYRGILPKNGLSKIFYEKEPNGFLFHMW